MAITEHRPNFSTLHEKCTFDPTPVVTCRIPVVMHDHDVNWDWWMKRTREPKSKSITIWRKATRKSLAMLARVLFHWVLLLPHWGGTWTNANRASRQAGWCAPKISLEISQLWKRYWNPPCRSTSKSLLMMHWLYGWRWKGSLSHLSKSLNSINLWSHWIGDTSCPVGMFI